MIEQVHRDQDNLGVLDVATNNENLHHSSKTRQKATDLASLRYVATGVVANARLSPLLPAHWEDITSRRAALESKSCNGDSQTHSKKIPDFLWENAPRHETKEIRDHVKVYSHLPNGINILDSKWVLGRLFSEANRDANDESPYLATCETHCFTGKEGFCKFARSVKLLAGESNHLSDPQLQKEKLQKLISDLPDIAPDKILSLSNVAPRPPPEVLNWWVVKDAGANGAGGVWVVGTDTANEFATNGPLMESHKYVAQQYVWPPVLYEGKKCHVRVYTTVTCDGKAFVHQRAFLHVANDLFTIYGNDTQSTNNFEDCVHITNCCANSHDDTKFAGEILAHFGQTEYSVDEKTQQPVVPLADFFPSVQVTVSEVVSRIFQNRLLEGGLRNNGFEYCGMDFMLSYKPQDDGKALPVAYLLEINSPPSQDTASSLPHAEDLHNEVLRDWMTNWVIPRVDPTIPIRSGGWIECDVKQRKNQKGQDELAVPSKAAMLNKFRWALFERKLQKNESLLASSTDVSETNVEKGTQKRNCEGIDDGDACDNNYPSAIQISRFARSQFPFFSTSSNSDGHGTGLTENERHQIFFENAGGAQVPQTVIDQMTVSLTRRHRNKIGSDTKLAARETIRRLLVGGTEQTIQKPSAVILGLNATSLLQKLAQRYSKLLTPSDEVLISTENHLANFDPWIHAAISAGAKIKLWAPFAQPHTFYEDSLDCEISSDLNHLVTSHTRIVALPHASNILGSVRPIADLAKSIKDRSKGYAHVVVDGVAVAPHEFVGFDESFGGNVDWYVVSMHKLFGPHIGVLLARQNRYLDELLETRAVLADMKTKEERIQAMLESGTANIEGCAGVVGLGMYFKSLSQWCQGKSTDTNPAVMVSVQEARVAYRMIRKVEEALLQVLMRGLAKCSRIRILDGSSSIRMGHMEESYRLPTVSFVHESISSLGIYNHCQQHGIICRSGFFLCTQYLARDLEFHDVSQGVFRVSLAHYNTPEEVQALCDTLESIPKWFGGE